MKKYEEFLRVDYTPEELAEMSQDLARATQARGSLEQQKKQVDAQLKAQIEAQNTDIGRLASSIVNKGEWRNVECVVELDTPMRGRKRIVRLDTGEEVRVVGMTDADRQMVLDLEQKADAEEAAKNPPQEPIVTPPPYVPRIDEPGVVEAASVSSRSIRLLREVRSDIPGDWMAAMPGVYGPDRIQVNQHGAVAIVTPQGPLGVKPDEMEWVEPTETANGAPLAQAAVMGGTHQRKQRKAKDAKQEAAADGSGDELD